jgi:hypothetical protein
VEALAMMAELQTSEHDKMGDKPEFVTSATPRKIAAEEPEPGTPEPLEIEEAALLEPEEALEEEEVILGQTPNDEVLLKFLEKTDTDVPE